MAVEQAFAAVRVTPRKYESMGNMGNPEIDFRLF